MITNFVLAHIKSVDERDAFRRPKADKDGDIPMYVMDKQNNEDPSSEEGEQPEDDDEWGWWNDICENMLCAFKGKGQKGKGK